MITISAWSMRWLYFLTTSLHKYASSRGTDVRRWCDPQLTLQSALCSTCKYTAWTKLADVTFSQVFSPIGNSTFEHERYSRVPLQLSSPYNLPCDIHIFAYLGAQYSRSPYTGSQHYPGWFDDKSTNSCDKNGNKISTEIPYMGSIDQQIS